MNQQMGLQYMALSPPIQPNSISCSSNATVPPKITSQSLFYPSQAVFSPCHQSFFLCDAMNHRVGHFMLGGESGCRKPVALWNCSLSAASANSSTSSTRGALPAFRSMHHHSTHNASTQGAIRYMWRSTSSAGGSALAAKGVTSAAGGTSSSSSSNSTQSASSLSATGNFPSCISRHEMVYAVGSSGVKGWNTSGILTTKVVSPEFQNRLSAAVDEQDERLFMGSDVGKLWLWDVSRGKFVVRTWDENSLLASNLVTPSIRTPGVPSYSGVASTGARQFSNSLNVTPTAQHNIVGITKMLLTNKFLVCARTDGSIQLRDKQSLEILHEWTLHSGPINDVAVKEDLLITCGFSKRPNGLDYDRQLKCLDLRTMSLLPSITFMYDGPAFIRFHPSYQNILVVVSQNGLFQCKEVVHDMKVYPVHHIFPKEYHQSGEPQHIVSFDISPSGEVFSFVDNMQRVHLWGSSSNPKVPHSSLFQKKKNGYKPFKEYKPDFTHASLQMTESSPLNMVSTYESGHSSIHHKSFLSDVDMNSDIGKFSTPKHVHPKLMKNIQQHLTSFKKRPGIPSAISENVRFTQNPGLLSMEEGYVSGTQSPHQFQPNSGKAEDGKSTSSNASSPRSNFASPNADSHLIPQSYRFRSSAIDGWKEVDFLQFNRTQYTGLENSLENSSLFNAFVQILYHMHEPLRNSILSHSCDVPECLTCQLGFLFGMMRTKQQNHSEQWCNKTCFPGNLMRILNRRLSTIAQEGASSPTNVFNTSNSHNSTPNMIHFLLSSCSKELSRDENYPISTEYPHMLHSPNHLPTELVSKSENRTQKLNILELLLSSVSNIRHRCTSCSFEKSHESQRMFFRISLSSPNCTFEEAIQNSISNVRTENTKRKCNKCNRLSSFENISHCRTLPNVLSFVFSDAGTDQSWLHRKYSGQSTGELRSNQSENVHLPVSRVLCVHGKSVAPILVLTWNEEQQTWLVHSEYDEKRVEEEEYDSEDPNSIRIVYELRSFMCKVHHPLSDSSGHHVAFIKTEEEPDKWHLFNDFTISRQTKRVYDFSTSWKKANMFMYVRRAITKRDVSARNAESTKEQVNISPEIDAQDALSVEKELRGCDPLPQKGDFVAIDAEFVQLEKCAELSLGRVSVLREDGSVLIDDHIGLGETEDVSDYLTRYSGLREGDLNQTSHHNVVELKTAYRKLKALVDSGVIFVGHGLKSDFKIINLVVPPDQIRDTVELFQLPNQRKIGLRFLSQTLLKEDVQRGEHDSIEDASTALRLYKMYERLLSTDEFESTLDSVYQVGRETNWATNNHY